MDNLAVVVSNDNIVDCKTSMNAIKKAGFNNVFLQWYDVESDFDQYAQLDYARSIGLNVVFAHLGYQKINNLWLENQEGENLKNRFISDIKTCHELGINFVVLHLTSKTKAPMFGTVGLNRIKQICDYASSLGVKIGFENTKLRGYIEYIVTNITNDNIGFCLDVGHLHAHFNDEFNFPLVNNKIVALHLHDNMGDKDAHLLPFDGNIDWQNMMKTIRECNYKGYTTLEVVYSNEYENISVDEFYQIAYQRAIILNDMLFGENNG